MDLPAKLRDRPLTALTEYLRDGLNDRVWAIFDAAGEPRQNAVNAATVGRVDLRTQKVFPLLSVAKPEILNAQAGLWGGEIRWHVAMSTKGMESQHHLMDAIERILVDLLLAYNDSEQPCLLIDIQFPITGSLNYITIFRGNDATALSFPVLELRFRFTDLEPAP